MGILLQCGIRAESALVRPARKYLGKLCANRTVPWKGEGPVAASIRRTGRERASSVVRPWRSRVVKGHPSVGNDHIEQRGRQDFEDGTGDRDAVSARCDGEPRADAECACQRVSGEPAWPEEVAAVHHRRMRSSAPRERVRRAGIECSFSRRPPMRTLRVQTGARAVSE